MYVVFDSGKKTWIIVTFLIFNTSHISLSLLHRKIHTSLNCRACVSAHDWRRCSSPCTWPRCSDHEPVRTAPDPPQMWNMWFPTPWSKIGNRIFRILTKYGLFKGSLLGIERECRFGVKVEAWTWPWKVRHFDELLRRHDKLFHLTMVADRKMAYWHWLTDTHAPILVMLLKFLFDLPLSLISLAALVVLVHMEFWFSDHNTDLIFTVCIFKMILKSWFHFCLEKCWQHICRLSTNDK